MNRHFSAQLTEQKRTWDARAGGFVTTKHVEKPLPFICGPLPLAWVNAAGALPGKTLQVGLALWYLSGLCKSRTVRLGSKQLMAMGVARDAKYEALARLRDAGLRCV